MARPQNPETSRSAQKHQDNSPSVKNNLSVKSILIEHDEVFNSLLEEERGLLRSFGSLEKVVSLIMVGLCGVLAHFLVLMQVKFYDAVDFVSKVFFPILFFYLPIIGYIKTFKNWWMIVPLVAFLAINLVSFV